MIKLSINNIINVKPVGTVLPFHHKKIKDIKQYYAITKYL